MRKLPNYGVSAHQREAIAQFVGKKSDVLVNLPTGYGKSFGGFKGTSNKIIFEFEFDSSFTLVSV